MEHLDHPSPAPYFNETKMARFLLLRAFIIVFGGKGVNCSFLFCPRLQVAPELTRVDCARKIPT